VPGADVALLGGEAKPPHRLGVILGDTFAVVVHEPEIVLSTGVALFGSEAQRYHPQGFRSETSEDARTMFDLRPGG